MYWLLVEEIPHSTKFASLSKLVRNMGCVELALLEDTHKTKYTSQRIIKDHVLCITKVIRNEIINDIKESPVYSIMIDETTDVSVTKQMIVYCKYICTTKVTVKSAFLGLIALKGLYTCEYFFVIFKHFKVQYLFLKNYTHASILKTIILFLFLCLFTF